MQETLDKFARLLDNIHVRLRMKRQEQGVT
jgi:hypothetical protein